MPINNTEALRHRVTVESATSAQDAYGDQVLTWSTYCVRSMSARTMRASERLRNGIDLAEQVQIFLCRHDSVAGAITPRMRINFRNRIWDIASVVNVDERDQFLEITARTIQ